MESVEIRCAECGHAASAHIPATHATKGQNGCMAPSGDKWAGSDYCSCSRAQEECAQPREPRRGSGHVDDCSCELNATETVRYTDRRCAALQRGSCDGQHLRDLENVLERMGVAVRAANPDSKEPPPDEDLFEWMQRVAGVDEPPGVALARRPLRAALQDMIPDYRRLRDAVIGCATCKAAFDAKRARPAASRPSGGRRRR